ncbi:MAG: hypothetical protein ACD_56C00067G0001 [uncultured bacterium]|nr:MAG: hypothetical protein ACD_56C00067G0001 [uncultured bacterium]
MAEFGIRARLRFLWEQSLGGSSPLSPTAVKKKDLNGKGSENGSFPLEESLKTVGLQGAKRREMSSFAHSSDLKKTNKGD